MPLRKQYCVFDEGLGKKSCAPGKRQEFEKNEPLYYLSPARKGDIAGSIVPASWSFSDLPCVFLEADSCAIQPVKPKGGRTLSCRLMTLSKNQMGYGKKQAVLEWKDNLVMKRLMGMKHFRLSEQT